jgi:ketol-acid reductoisomerase
LNYKEQLSKELAAMGNSEMWLAGKATRSLRPQGKEKGFFKLAKGTAGRKSN